MVFDRRTGAVSSGAEPGGYHAQAAHARPDRRGRPAAGVVETNRPVVAVAPGPCRFLAVTHTNCAQLAPGRVRRINVSNWTSGCGKTVLESPPASEAQVGRGGRRPGACSRTSTKGNNLAASGIPGGSHDNGQGVADSVDDGARRRRCRP